MRPPTRAPPGPHFDRPHHWWAPALGPHRFSELYCDTWRRSVLNLRGRKSVWQWMREVDPWNALFLMQALRRTQKMLDPQHYLAEYDLVPPAQSVVTALQA
jgi:hypothetical protein